MSSNAAQVTRPILRYHGGKWRLAPWIISHFPAHRVYVEPFGGAASVLLRKPRSYVEVYNDLDGEIVNLFRVLRDPTQARELERLLRLTPFARAEFEAAYLGSGDPIEQARRTIIRSCMGFGSDSLFKVSGFRANTTWPGKRPAGDWAGYPDLVASFTRRLQGVVIENRPALEVIQAHDGPKTLHYVDPPYVAQTRSYLRQVKYAYRFEMSDDQHRELAEVLHSVKGMVVISGYPCELYDKLYSDWQCVTRTALADGARRRTEVLWLSPAASSRLSGMMLFPLPAQRAAVGQEGE